MPSGLFCLFCVFLLTLVQISSSTGKGGSFSTGCEKVCGIAKPPSDKKVESSDSFSDYSNSPGFDIEDFYSEAKDKKSTVRKKRTVEGSKKKKTKGKEKKRSGKDESSEANSTKPEKEKVHKKDKPVKPSKEKLKEKKIKKSKKEKDSTSGERVNGTSGSDYSGYEEEEEDDPTEETDEQETEVDEGDNRIVNGYSPKERPWLAFLAVTSGACGGALVNTKFVISAAHCFCRPEKPILCNKVTIEGKPTSSPAYNVKDHVKIYLGINGMDIRNRDRNKENIYRPIKVTIRAGWVFGDSYNPDMAMIELERKVTFIPEVIAPLCLPPAPDFPDKTTKEKPISAFVAGWGAGNSQCDSEAFGPDPFTMCKFPSVFQGKTLNQCSMGPPPSTQNTVCNEFFEWAKGPQGQKEGIKQPGQMKLDETYTLYFWDSKSKEARETTCYSHSVGQYGWCGTCYPGDLQPGSEGYCDKYDVTATFDKPKEMGKPRPDSRWGWCAAWCNNASASGLANTVQETRLDILSENECNDLGSTLGSNATIEICTGKKRPWPKIRKFKKVFNKATGKYYFASQGTAKSYLGFGTKQKYDFFLGGTDSCQGDSGGPLFMWHGTGKQSRAHMIGVVSRGTGCANFNQPGIFTRVTFHLRWIHEMIKSGNCS